jgi:hypothetical protein
MKGRIDSACDDALVFILVCFYELPGCLTFMNWLASRLTDSSHHTFIMPAWLPLCSPTQQTLPFCPHLAPPHSLQAPSSPACSASYASRPPTSPLSTPCPSRLGPMPPPSRSPPLPCCKTSCSWCSLAHLPWYMTWPGKCQGAYYRPNIIGWADGACRAGRFLHACQTAFLMPARLPALPACLLSFLLLNAPSNVLPHTFRLFTPGGQLDSHLSDFTYTLLLALHSGTDVEPLMARSGLPPLPGNGHGPGRDEGEDIWGGEAPSQEG